MDTDALRVWLGSLDACERRELAAAVRVGVQSLLTARRRNGASFDPSAPNALLAALSARQRSFSGQDGTGYVTISAVDGMPARRLRRWAAAGRVRARKVGPVWLVHLDDVQQERNRR